MKRCSRSSVWLLDLALVLFGLLVLFLVTRILRFDDPNLLGNAWTYFLLVPTVLIGSAMLARVLISEQAERSIQAGFLLSVLVHLGLTYVALHTVLFAGSGSQGEQRAVAQANKKRLLEASRASSFVPSVERMQVDGKVSQTKPDYLRPVEVAQTLEDSIDFQPQTQAPRALERLDRDRFELPLEPTLQAGVELGDAQRANDAFSEPELVVTEMERIVRPENQERLEQGSAEGQRKIEYESALVDAGAQEDVLVGRTPSLERLAPSSSSASVLALAEGFSQIAIPGLTEVGSTARGAMQVRRGVVGASEQVPLPKLDDGLRGPERLGALEGRSESVGRVSRVPIPAQRLQEVQGLQDERGGMEGGGGVEGGGGMAVASDGGEVSTDLAAMLADRVQTRVSREVAGGLSGGVAGSLDFGAIDPLALPMASGVTGSSGGLVKGKGSGESFEGRERVGIEVGGSSASIGGLASEAASLSQFRRPLGRVAGGVMGMKELVPIPAPAFEQRMRRIDDLGSGVESRVGFGDELGAMGALGPQTELAIERGLEFLAKYQRSDGSWHLEDYGRGTLMRSDTAATALALLAFQGAGYSHVQAKHRDVCGRALTYLLGGQRPNGDLYRPMDEVSDRNSWLYSHAIGSLALCEAYGMTRDETLRSGAQRAIDFLVASQDVKEGGWRYAPRVGSDTSVTGWAMMALKSAELSGLSVPEQTYDRISGWLDRSQGSGEGQGYLYRYNYLANTPETEHGRFPTPVMTSVGLLMRLYLGWDREHPMMLQGAQWLSARRPTLGTKQIPQRDTYYWYYATQVMFHVGGESWEGWYEALYPMLVETQVSEGIYAGSWEPDGPIPDAWGAYAGRLYVTTMNLLSLEVTYRHLPIYEAVVR